MRIGSRVGTVESIPKGLRTYAQGVVDEVSLTYSPSEALQSAALLAHSIRVTAAEEFRALITYNSDPSEWPASRDASYSAVFSSVMMEFLTTRGLDEDALTALYESLIAMAALEETIGVREPRAACVQSFESALKNAVLLTLGEDIPTAASTPTPTPTPTMSPSDFAARTRELEKALGMMSRLPEDRSGRMRFSAFNAVVGAVLEGDGTSAGLRRVEEVYAVVAEMLGVEKKSADSVVQPLGRGIFDRSVGEIVISPDFAPGGLMGASNASAAIGAMLMQQGARCGVFSRLVAA